MRHKYATRALVLARTPHGEAGALVVLLTAELGLVRARAAGLRRPGAKLAASLATFAESDVVLVRGSDGWRLAGAVQAEGWFRKLGHADARRRVARVTGLLLRLVAGEERDDALFPFLISFFACLASASEEECEHAEVLAALDLLSLLGLDDGTRAATNTFSPERLATVGENRLTYITRINRGLAASGLV